MSNLMSTRLFKRGATMVVLVAVAAVVLQGSKAVDAAVPDNAGSVRICYQTSGLLANGQARVIDTASASCTAGSETAVNLDKATPGNFMTNLVGADFTGADLSYRNFYGADLRNTIFNQTKVKGSDLRTANLSGAAINTILDTTTFSFGTTPNLSNTTWTDGGLVGADLRTATLTGATLTGGTFTSVDLRNINFSGITTQGMTINNSNLSGTNFTANADASGYLYFNSYGTNFSNANFTGTNRTIVGTMFDHATVTGANFTNVGFRYADLRGTNFTTATMGNNTWFDTWCPDGANSDTVGNTCTGHLSA